MSSHSFHNLRQHPRDNANEGKVAMKAKRNLQVDLVIFGLFLLLIITGVMLERGDRAVRDLHSVVGLFVLVGIGVHLALHWKWVVAVSARIFGKVARQARVNYILDALLLFCFIIIGLSGVVIWINGQDEGLIILHGWSAVMLIVLSTVHLTLHWKWIVSTTRRYPFFGLRNSSLSGSNPRSIKRV